MPTHACATSEESKTRLPVVIHQIRRDALRSRWSGVLWATRWRKARLPFATPRFAASDTVRLEDAPTVLMTSPSPPELSASTGAISTKLISPHVYPSLTAARVHYLFPATSAKSRCSVRRLLSTSRHRRHTPLMSREQGSILSL